MAYPQKRGVRGGCIALRHCEEHGGHGLAEVLVSAQFVFSCVHPKDSFCRVAWVRSTVGSDVTRLWYRTVAGAAPYAFFICFAPGSVLPCVLYIDPSGPADVLAVTGAQLFAAC